MDTDLRDFLFDQYKESCEFQYVLNEKIRTRISFVSGFLVPLGAAFLYVTMNYPHSWKAGWSLFFYGPVSLASLLFLIAILLVFYCVGWGFKYSYITPPDTLQEYVDAVARFAAANPTLNVNELDKIKTNLMHAYSKAATLNWRNNVVRTNVILNATRILIISFMLLLSALPRFFYDRTQQTTSPTKVIVTEPIRIQK